MEAGVSSTNFQPDEINWKAVYLNWWRYFGFAEDAVDVWFLFLFLREDERDEDEDEGEDEDEDEREMVATTDLYNASGMQLSTVFRHIR